MYKVVFLRHGESEWNKLNKFTGWTDVDLTKKGEEEARAAGSILKKKGYDFDEIFCSPLKRAIRTMWFVQDEMDRMWLPVHISWRLNERHYGALQGFNKAQMAKKVGEEQVHIWRRSYDVAPPKLKKSDPRFPGKDPRYAHLDASLLPLSESLKDTVERVLPYWHDTIVPEIKSGKRILVVAHGNSLRALVKYLNNISDEEIPHLNIPTGIPLVYEFTKNMNVKRSYYLGNQAAIKKAAKKVAAQGKVKK